ncbi:MAG: glycine--tRNA ligase [Patescibacteria group bacterium]|nr:glycine--tRNA ligase [Patescibacteria group bacterium]
MDKIISLCKRRGFVYPASEIYGGFANAFDYGPLGVQLKKNIKDIWWKKFITERDDMVGLDSAIIQNPKVWEASGHLKSFSDPLVECKKCHKRFRQDHIQELKNQVSGFAHEQIGIQLSQEQKEMLYCKGAEEHEFTEAKNFNLMFKTFIGVSEDSASTAYLRPETAQGIFINFQNVIQSTRQKLPFGIAQIGKAFRNEITPGNFIFRTREFEQGEIEYFIKPEAEESKKWYEYWIKEVNGFYTDLGIKKENLSMREHSKEELSHYSSGTSDIEYKFPFGVSELAGIAQRTDFDLKAHGLQYFNDEAGEKLTPYVVEPSMGIDRAALAFLIDAYDESDGKDGRAEGEITLHLHPKLAPIKVAVFPLMKKEGLPEVAKKIASDLRKAGIETYYDESGSVGKRYRRQDEIGTPWCITVDFDTIKDETVTIRDRDTMKQERITLLEITDLISSKLK